MLKPLVVYAHPYPNKSRANRVVFNELLKIRNIKSSDLYEKYPYFNIDKKAEQQDLIDCDLLILQFPLYWYSVPPMLKLWFDEVLEQGFAYGLNGTQLSGKKLLISLTCGGSAEAYSENGFHQTELKNFFAPWIQTARLCKMVWQEPNVLYGATKADDKIINSHAIAAREKIERLGQL